MHADSNNQAADFNPFALGLKVFGVLWGVAVVGAYVWLGIYLTGVGGAFFEAQAGAIFVMSGPDFSPFAWFPKSGYACIAIPFLLSLRQAVRETAYSVKRFYF